MHSLRFFCWPTWLIALTLGFVALGLQLCAFNGEMNIYDEGIILVGAQQVAQGKRLYQDIFTMYAPAQFYLTATLLAWFDYAALALRSIGFISKALITIFVFLLVVRFTARSYAVITALICLCLLIAVGQDAFPIFPALAFCLLALNWFEAGLRLGKGYFVLAGLASGLAMAFRHDLGLYGVLGITLGLILAVQLQRLRPSVQASASASSPATAPAQAPEQALAVSPTLTWYGMGLVVVLAPLGLWLLASVPLADLLYNLLTIPASIYPAVRALPFPSWSALVAANSLSDAAFIFSVYLPFGVLALALLAPWIGVAQVWSAKTNKVDTKSLWPLILILGVTCLLFTIKGLVRVSPIHLVQSLVLAIAMLGIGWSRFQWRVLSAPVFFIAALILSIALILGPVTQGIERIGTGVIQLARGTNPTATACLHPSLPRLRCLFLDRDSLLAAQYIQAHSQQNARIYVGTSYHDKLFVNGVALYFIAERAPVSKWYELHPGVQTQQAIQKEMITEMQNPNFEWIVLDSRWEKILEPNGSSISSGVTLLDQFIATHFVEVAQFGTLRILKRTQ